jgi:Bacterial protein of unknown function (DUF853)
MTWPTSHRRFRWHTPPTTRRLILGEACTTARSPRRRRSSCHCGPAAKRAQELGMPFQARGFPVEFLALGGIGPGIPVRATVSDFGPQLLAKVLGANETQEQSLSLVFHYADQKGLPLLEASSCKRGRARGFRPAQEENVRTSRDLRGPRRRRRPRPGRRSAPVRPLQAASGRPGPIRVRPARAR